MKPYRILVVDDSPFMRKIISDLIEQDKSFWVERTAANGREALEQIEELSPDLVTMDVEMPEMNGLEALRLIMEKHPVPVIMLSGINEQGMRETIMALELGAFDFIKKPSLSSSSQGIQEVGELLREKIRVAMLSQERRLARKQDAVRQQAEEPKVLPHPKASIADPSTAGPAVTKPAAKPSVVKPTDLKKTDMVTRKDVRLENVAKSSSASETAGVPSIKPVKPIQPSAQEKRIAKAPKPESPILEKESPVRVNAFSSTRTGTFTDLVAIGCSTGGPKALKTLLEQIPRDFPAPIVIVQHMPPNFTKSLAQRLNSLCDISVVEGEDGMVLQKGTAYIAPGAKHLNVISGPNGQYRISLTSTDPCNGHRPSVDVMYESLLSLTGLRRHIVLLTGMGSDGAKMMKRLFDAGVATTIAESEETCVVYGMPRSAVELKCVNHVLPLHNIAPKLVQIVK